MIFIVSKRVPRRARTGEGWRGGGGGAFEGRTESHKGVFCISRVGVCGKKSDLALFIARAHSLTSYSLIPL